MKAVIALAFAVLLLWLVYGRLETNRQIAEDRRVIAELTDKQNKAVDESSSFELQSRCADAAKEFFKRIGYSSDQNPDFTNHYNGKLRKCFIVTSTRDMKTSPGNVLFSENVFDAVEGKSYGEYIWESEKGKKYWEVAPLSCVVSAIDGSQKFCHSEEEFASLMAIYADVNH